MCFECLAPNSKIETNTGNNTLCKTFEIVGIADNEKSFVKIYPNPAHDFIIIDDQESELKGIELTDIYGRIILIQATIEPLTKIDMYHLTPGIYIIKLVTVNGFETHIIIRE